LAKVGLLKLNKTQEKGGIIEKYYLPIAKGYRICLEGEPLNKSGEKSSRHILLKTLFEEYEESYLDAEGKMELIEHIKKSTPHKPILKLNTLYLTSEKQSEFYQELELFFQKWNTSSNQDTKANIPVRLLLSAH
jgi:hypothetical protein